MESICLEDIRIGKTKICSVCGCIMKKRDDVGLDAYFCTMCPMMERCI